VNLPTWQQLVEYYCTASHHRLLNKRISNPFYEELACRRYNHAASSDTTSCRMVFLKDVLKGGDNKTLRRDGRFVWCHDLHYEGRDDQGFRQISFSVDKGKKRFTIPECNMLCVPSSVYVNNNRYFRSKEKTFFAFSTVFGYANTRAMLAKSSGVSLGEFTEIVDQDNPYKPGTLVAPRLGYFYPHDVPATKPQPLLESHPYGIILGRTPLNDHMGREFYRVRFAGTTYERVHPVQLEIVNEV
jgi:hypothetical protein